MHGKIEFKSLEKMAAFLKTLVGTTVVFEAHETTDGIWIVEFNGAY